MNLSPMAALGVLRAGDRPYALVCGDSLLVLAELPADTFSGALIDPPYGLGSRAPTPEEILAFLAGDRLDHGGDFMGSAWDIPTVAFWRELYRVMKPGAWIGVYGGTQADDLLSMAARLGGFVREDAIEVFGTARFAWLQSQGMPHGLNVSRAIDEAAGVDREVTIEVDRYHDGGRRAEGTQNHDPRMFHNNANGMTTTLPATPEAEQWEGFHTQLSPKHEVVLLFRKPAAPVTSEELRRVTEWDHWHVVTAVRTEEARAAATARFGVEVPRNGKAQVRRRRPLHPGARESYELRWRPEHIIETTRRQRVVDCGACGEAPVDAAAKGCPTCSGLFVTFREIEVVDETRTLGPWEVIASVDVGPYEPWSTDATAAIVLVRGVGALNIDATRVYTDWNEPGRGEAWKRSGHTKKPDAKKIAGAPPGQGITLHAEGRFTPNVAFVHDPGCVCTSRSSAGTASWDCTLVCPTCGPSTAPAGGHAPSCPTCGAARAWLCPRAELDAQSGVLTTGAVGPGTRDCGKVAGRLGGYTGRMMPERSASSGGASRSFSAFTPNFLYAAKVPPRERNAGLPKGRENPGLCLKPLSLGVHLARLICPPGGIALTTHAGTGSEVAALVLAGSRAFGIEKDPATLAVAEEHIPGLLALGGAPISAKKAPEPTQASLSF